MAWSASAVEAGGQHLASIGRFQYEARRGASSMLLSIVVGNRALAEWNAHDTDTTICRGVTVELHYMTAKCIQVETVGTSHQ